MSTTAIEEKVRAILERANHPGTPKEEAETAFAMAQRLILKHNLDEAALHDRVEDDEIVRDVIKIRGTWALNRLEIAAVVARANSLACYRSSACGEWETNSHGRYVRKKIGYDLHIFGTKADIFATKTIWTAVEALCSRTMPKGNKAYRNSWLMGFQSGIWKALETAKKAVVDTIVAEGGSALVLVDRSKRADNEMRASVKNLRSTSARQSTGGGYSDGRSAGASFSTGGIGGGAIGALGR